MATSMTALTATPAHLGRVTVARTVASEEVFVRPSAASRRDSSERVIEGELLRDVSRADFSIDDIIGVQADMGFDPRFSPSLGVASKIIAANDAVAAYVSNGAVFSNAQRQVDTFV